MYVPFLAKLYVPGPLMPRAHVRRIISSPRLPRACLRARARSQEERSEWRRFSRALNLHVHHEICISCYADDDDDDDEEEEEGGVGKEGRMRECCASAVVTSALITLNASAGCSSAASNEYDSLGNRSIRKRCRGASIYLRGWVVLVPMF